MNSTSILKTLLSFIIIGVFSSGTTLFSQDRKTRDTENRADELFEKGEYTEAKKLYSNLVALYPKEPTYNYRYGACILYSEPEKSKALKYLNFAAATADSPIEALYYAGLGYHYNYRFDQALKYYNKFKANAKNRQLKDFQIERQIRMASNGQQLLRKVSEPQVKNRTSTSAADFHLSYNLPGSDHKFLRMLSEFRTKTDENKNYYGLMYKHSHRDEIWFSSYGDDGTAGLEIFRIKIDENGTFQKPEKLPASINTEFDEAYPFFNYKTNTLYFASKGHTSMGGFDIFKIEYDPDTDTWGTAKNMDYAFNTPDDDFLYAETESTAFFTSTRNNNEGRVTVYEINPANQELKTALIVGTFKPELYKKAEITVTQLPENEIVGTFETDNTDGRYIIPLAGNSKYQFSVKPSGSNTSHQGEVRIPKVSSATPLLQTMSVIKDGEEEKLVINNQFGNREVDDELMAAYFAKMANLRKDAPAQKSISQSNEDITKEIKNAEEKYQKRSKDLSEQAKKATSLASSKLLKARDLKDQSANNPEDKELEEKYSKTLAQSDAAAHYAVHLEQEAENEMQKALDLSEKLKKAQTYVDAGNREKTVETYLKYQDEYHTKGEKKPDDQAYFNYVEYAEKQESKAAEYRKSINKLITEKSDLEEQRSFLAGEQKRTRKNKDKKEIQEEIDTLTEDITYVKEEISKLKNKENQVNAEAEHMMLRAETIKSIRDEIQNSTATSGDTSPSKILAQTENEIRRELLEIKDYEVKREDTDELAQNETPGENTDFDNSQNPNDEVTKETDDTTEKEEVKQGEDTNNEDLFADQKGSAPKDASQEDSKEELSEFERLRAERKELREEENTGESEKKESAEIPEKDTPIAEEESLVINDNIEENENNDLVNEQPQNDEINEQSDSTAQDTNSSKESTPEPESPSKPEGNLEQGTERDKVLLNQEEPSKQGEPPYEPPAYEAFYDKAEEKVDEIEDPAAKSLALLDLKKQRIEKTEKEIELLEEKRSEADANQEDIINRRVSLLQDRKSTLETEIESTEKEFHSARKRNKDFTPGAEFKNSFTIQDIEDKYFFEYETLNEENPREQIKKSVTITKNYIGELKTTREKLSAGLESLPEEDKNYDKIKSEISFIDDVIELKQKQIDYNENILSLSGLPEYDEDVVVELPASEPELAVETTPRQTGEQKGSTPNSKEDKSDKAKTSPRTQKEEHPAPVKDTTGNNHYLSQRIKKLEDEIQSAKENLKSAQSNLETAEENFANAKRRKRKQAEIDLQNAQAGVESAQLKVRMNSILSAKIKEIQAGETFENLPSKQLEDSAAAAQKASKKTYEQGISLREDGEEEEALEKMKASSKLTRDADEFQKLAEILAEIENKTGVKEKDSATSPASPSQPGDRLISFESQKNLSKTDRETAENQDEFKRYEKAQTRFSLKLRQASVMYDDARDMEYKGARLNAAARDKKREGASDAEIAALEEEAEYLYDQSQKQKRRAEEQRKSAIIEYNQARENLKTSSSEHSEKMLALAAEKDEPFKKLADTPLPSLDTEKSFAELTDAEKPESPQQTEETPELAIESQSRDTSGTNPVSETTSDYSDTEYIDDEPSRPSDLTRTTRAAESSFTSVKTRTSENQTQIPLLFDSDEVSYRVQVAAFSQRVNSDYFPFGPMAAEELPNGILRYLAGNFENRDEAEAAKEEIRQAGYQDAFVVAYKGNSKISLAEASTSKPESQEDRRQAEQNINLSERITLNTSTISPQIGTPVQADDIVDVNARSELFFTVQIGAFSNQTPVSDLPFISPMNKDDLGNGIIQYSTGVFARLPEAVEAKNNIRSTVSDAFVTAYYKGERISIERALELGSDQKQDTDTAEKAIATQTATKPREQEIPKTETRETQQNPEPATAENERNPEAPKGIESGQYTVEVGPYEGKVPVAEARQILQLSSMGINIQKTSDATYYQIGIFDDNDSAEKLAKDLRRKGISEAKVIEYKK